MMSKERIDEYLARKTRRERLRAAGPELLEALKWALLALDAQCNVSETYYDHTAETRRKMVIAIAKAEGSQS